MNNYISKKDLEEAYKKMEEEPLVLPPKAYKELQKIILENKQLEEKIDKAIKFIKENACYGIQEECCLDDLNYKDCDELLEILGDKE